MMVSKVRKMAKIAKKLPFSNATISEPDFNIGRKIKYAKPILMVVNAKKVYPTLSKFFCLTKIKISTITAAQLAKNVYKKTSEW